MYPLLEGYVPTQRQAGMPRSQRILVTLGGVVLGAGLLAAVDVSPVWLQWVLVLY